MTELQLALGLDPGSKVPGGGVPGSGLDPAVRAFRTVLALAHLLRSRMDERLRADGLTTMQAAVLTAVLQLGRPTASDLATALGSSRQNIAQLVAALRRKGLLTIEADPGDRRRQRLAGTGRATAYWAGRDTGDVAAVREWFAVLDDDELGRLIALGTRLLTGTRPGTIRQV